jgi:protein disulfide-isomerase
MTWTRPGISWLFGAERGEPYRSLKARWLDAAAAIGRREGASAETKLLSAGPLLDFHKLENADAPAPEALRSAIERAVRDATDAAKSESDRHAVASHAAFFLRSIGEVERARSILLAEAERSDTPWYYQSSLSALEQQLGNEKAAKEWSAKARKSARGPASRIQWIVNDIALNARADDPAQRAYLLGVLAEYYELATTLPDGFLGRNGARATQVAEALGARWSDPEIAALRARFRPRCEALGEAARSACRSHFESPLPAARP